MSDTVLIIDDCNDFREVVSDILEDEKFHVLEANCPSEAFSLLDLDAVDLILCDFNMPFTYGAAKDEFVQGNLVGINTIKELGWVYPHIPIIALSASTDNQIEEAQRLLGDVKILRKPISPKDLVKEIYQTCKINYSPLEQ